jgi:hypothetical protein
VSGQNPSKEGALQVTHGGVRATSHAAAPSANDAAVKKRILTLTAAALRGSVLYGSTTTTQRRKMNLKESKLLSFPSPVAALDRPPVVARPPRAAIPRAHAP